MDDRIWLAIQRENEFRAEMRAIRTENRVAIMREAERLVLERQGKLGHEESERTPQ